MQTKLFMYFYMKICFGGLGEITPAVVYATDRSKAVVLVLFLHCVALWFLLRCVSC